MRPAPINVHPANDLRCPSPLCGQRVGTHAVFKGWKIDRCPHCGVSYLVWATLGVANVMGLTPEQAAAVDPEEDRLTVVMRQVGRIRVPA
jgi:hypothetical protein